MRKTREETAQGVLMKQLKVRSPGIKMSIWLKENVFFQISLLRKVTRMNVFKEESIKVKCPS